MFFPPPRLSECRLGELPERLAYEFTKCLMHGSVPAPIVSRNAEDAAGCVAQSSCSLRQTVWGTRSVSSKSKTGLECGERQGWRKLPLIEV